MDHRQRAELDRRLAQARRLALEPSDPLTRERLAQLIEERSLNFKTNARSLKAPVRQPFACGIEWASAAAFIQFITRGSGSPNCCGRAFLPSKTFGWSVEPVRCWTSAIRTDSDRPKTLNTQQPSISMDGPPERACNIGSRNVRSNRGHMVSYCLQP
jgi:hypothetical protein